MPPLLIGHRGASRQAPENTLASFRLAFAQGADGIETDFRLTRDGEIVCLHDENARRTAGAELKVAEATFAELRRLDAGAWKGERWRGELIPTLAEVLAVLPPGKRLFLELKSGPEILPPLARTLASSGIPPADLRILSFDREVIRRAKELLPAHRACWLTDYRFRGVWRPTLPEIMATLEEIGADGLASRAQKVVDPPFVAALHASGRELHLWTVDDPAKALHFARLGVDSVMTNRPGALRACGAWGGDGER